VHQFEIWPQLRRRRSLISAQGWSASDNLGDNQSKQNETLKRVITYLTHIGNVQHNLKDLKPFQIVSLLDMLYEYAHTFVLIVRHVEELIDGLGWEKAPNGYFEDPAVATSYRTRLADTIEFCKAIGIDVSHHIARINEFADPQYRSTDQVKCLEARLEDLLHKIQDDLEDRSFLYIPNERCPYFDQNGLFGTEVASRFPKANQEIRQAGNCYAIGSHTACVFHLMRSVEHGARALVKSLRVTKQLPRPVELCTWDDLITTLAGGLNAMAKGRRKSTKVADKSEFYNHAVGQLRNFKDAWRNNVAHTRKMYQPGETKDIMDNTRQFMQHLALRLKE